MYAVMFFDLSWMFALVSPLSIMNVCHSVSLIYDGCMYTLMFPRPIMVHVLVFPSSIMNIYHGVSLI